MNQIDKIVRHYEFLANGIKKDDPNYLVRLRLLWLEMREKIERELR